MIPYKYLAKNIYLCTLSDDNTHITNSALALNKEEMRLVIEELRSYFRDKDDLAVNKRSIKSQVREWAAHNFLYDLGVCRLRTSNVDLNAPAKWYAEIGYFILSMLY